MNERYEQLRRAIEGKRLPLVVVDLDAVDRNTEALLSSVRDTGKTLRVATRSIRCPAVIDHVVARGGDVMPGLMTYSVEESAFLVDRGAEDVLVAYPSLQRSDIEILVELNRRDDVRVAIMIDSVEHAGMSGIARAIWSGKFFTFRLQEDGSLEAGLQNAIIGTEIIDAQVFIATMPEAMERRGEDPPGDLMEKFGLFEEPVEVDTEQSVMLDYELERINLFSSLIDEIRPVTEDSLAAAGIDIPEGVDSVDDLWIGRATAIFGFFEPQREFVLYFALHFDRDSMEFDVAE